MFNLYYRNTKCIIITIKCNYTILYYRNLVKLNH